MRVSQGAIIKLHITACAEHTKCIAALTTLQSYGTACLTWRWRPGHACHLPEPQHALPLGLLLPPFGLLLLLPPQAVRRPQVHQHQPPLQHLGLGATTLLHTTTGLRLVLPEGVHTPEAGQQGAGHMGQPQGLRGCCHSILQAEWRRRMNQFRSARLLAGLVSRGMRMRH